jgi:hypothetical protein
MCDVTRNGFQQLKFTRHGSWFGQPRAEPIISKPQNCTWRRDNAENQSGIVWLEKWNLVIPRYVVDIYYLL